MSDRAKEEMKTRKTVWGCLLVMLFQVYAGAVFSQTPLSLEQSIALALKNSVSLRSAASGVLGGSSATKGSAQWVFPAA